MVSAFFNSSSGKFFVDVDYFFSLIREVFGYENLVKQFQKNPYHFATEIVLLAFIIYILLAKRSYDPQKK